MKKFFKMLRLFLLAPAILLFGAEGDSGAGGAGTGGDPNAGGGKDPNGGSGSDPNKGKDPNAGGGGDPKLSMTQAELDAIITKRLSREQKAWETKLEEEKKKASMTEAEKLKAEKEEADKKAKDIQTAANIRIARTEFKIAAQAAGVPVDRLDAAVKLADLSDLTPDEKTGEIPRKVLDDAVKATLKINPFLQGTEGKGSGVGGGTNPGGGSGADVGGMNAFIRRAAGRQ
jgi:hypothetical protein